MDLGTRIRKNGAILIGIYTMRMNIFAYVDMYLCLFIASLTFLHLFQWIQLYVRLYLYLHVYVFLCFHVDSCFLQIHIYVYISICIRLYIQMHKYIYIYVWTSWDPAFLEASIAAADKRGRCQA